MYKEGGYWRTWHRRYFKLLDTGFLEYYVYHTDATPRGHLDLRNCKEGPLEVPQYQSWLSSGWSVKDFLFTLQAPDRLWQFSTEGQDSRTEWIKKLNEVLKNVSPTYQGPQHPKRNSGCRQSAEPKISPMKAEEVKAEAVCESPAKNENSENNKDCATQNTKPDSEPIESQTKNEEPILEACFTVPTENEISVERPRWENPSQILMQKCGFLSWVNMMTRRVFEKRMILMPHVSDLSELSDGCHLIRIVELVSKTEITFHHGPQTSLEKLQNVNALLGFLDSQIPDFPAHISADAIAFQSSATTLLDLIWAIMFHYEISLLQINTAVKGINALHYWITDRIKEKPWFNNFTESLLPPTNSLLRLVDSYELLQTCDHFDTFIDALRNRMELVEKKWNIPRFFEPEHFENFSYKSGLSVDLCIVLVWLSYIFRATH